MDLLLDTCAFIWWDSAGASLSPAATQAMQDSSNRLYLSHASLWEMQLKVQKGRLQLRKPIPELVDEQCRVNGLVLLSIEPQDIYYLSQLPAHHADPFDRIIIAQTLRRGMKAVTDDGIFRSYGVDVVW